MQNFDISTNSTSIPDKFIKNWQEIVNIMAEIINVPSGLIMRVSPPNIEVFVSSNTQGNPYEVGEKAKLSGLYCTTVMQSQRSLIVQDALNDPEWNQNPDIKLGMISYLGFPISWPNGEIFGTVCVLDSKPNAYTDNYNKLVGSFQKVIETDLELIFRNNDLQEALMKIHTLESILPICSSCKKIHSEEGSWLPVDDYFRMSKGTEFTHGLCPECSQKMLDEIPDN
ncbi:hypothetical protein NEF87_002503 [Candidatus Lokiarchaeum ossiferum]|uniref:GAF domain-containing protein n=1 Tax=Candidatus Lokiarchaeum ossiferum TaxID=2951803 RepID=A0ABY6HS84_9ARCH|nr:hypothetical protein NEF87_002503 [Candidatus Lokiarchaeum sp. B-35]